MSANDNRNIKRDLFLYAALSILVFFELYVLPGIIAPERYFKTVCFLEFNSPVNFVLSFLIFFAIFGVLSCGKKEISLREKPSYLFILFHFVIFLLSLFVILYFINTYSFEPLAENSVLLKLARLLNKKADYLTIRFDLAFLFILTLCHGSLLLSAWSIRIGKFIKNYIAAGAAVLLYLYSMGLWRFHDYLWAGLCRSVGFLNLCLLRVFGFKNSTLEFAPRDCATLTPVDFNTPVVYTGSYAAQIESPCSGLGGITAFLLVFVVILIADWKKLNKKKAAAVALAGTLIMYTANIIRIFALLLIGHFYGAERALELFHSLAGIFFYPVIIILTIAFSYRWMLKKA